MIEENNDDSGVVVLMEDDEFNLFCQELARLILGEDDLVRRSNMVAVLDEVLHSVDEIEQDVFGGRTALELALLGED